MKKAVEFITTYNNEKRHFIIETRCIKKDRLKAFTLQGTVLKYPVLYFGDVHIKTVQGGHLIDFHSDSRTWTGRKITEEDILSQVLEAYVRGDDSYEFIYIAPALKKILSFYLGNIACTVADRQLPKYIMKDNHVLYMLQLVTHEYTYYTNEDSFLMYRTSSMELISDNYFASVAYEQSLDNLPTGMETLLYVDKDIAKLENEYRGIDLETYVKSN